MKKWGVAFLLVVIFSMGKYLFKVNNKDIKTMPMDDAAVPYQPNSSQCFISIPPKNVRKPDFFCRFQKV